MASPQKELSFAFHTQGCVLRRGTGREGGGGWSSCSKLWLQAGTQSLQFPPQAPWAARKSRDILPKSILLHLTLSPQGRDVVLAGAINESCAGCFAEAFPEPRGRVCPSALWFFTAHRWFFTAHLWFFTAHHCLGLHSSRGCSLLGKESSGQLLPREQQDIDDLFRSLSEVIMYLDSLKMCISFLQQTRTASLVPV